MLLEVLGCLFSINVFAQTGSAVPSNQPSTMPPSKKTTMATKPTRKIAPSTAARATTPAATNVAPVPAAPATTLATPVHEEAKVIPRVAHRHNLLIDYNSWFENIRVVGGTPYETKALLYGAGVSYESAFLRQTWGWGIGVGILQGFAVAGDASDPNSYYAKRVPLNIARGGLRIFERVNPRFDLGLAASVLMALQSYPADKGFKVEAPSSLMIGAFLDTRWRMDSHWELIQSMGTYSRGPSLAWRLGTSYTF
jgi:hypothetical protein